MVMFLFNGTIVYQNFWFTIVFTLLCVLVCISQFSVKNYELWAEVNFRFILRKVAAVVFHGIIIIVFPYNLGLSGSIMYISSLLMLCSLIPYVIELILYIVWEVKGQ